MTGTTASASGEQGLKERSPTRRGYEYRRVGEGFGRAAGGREAYIFESCVKYRMAKPAAASPATAATHFQNASARAFDSRPAANMSASRSNPCGAGSSFDSATASGSAGGGEPGLGAASFISS